MKMLQKVLALCLSSWLLFAPAAINAAQTAQSAGQSAPQVVKQTPEELQQLVAPIALYPDALVSQIFAGATYPTEIVEADRWVQGHPNLKGKDLANAVDQQPWDPSIKALTQFPSVLANMDAILVPGGFGDRGIEGKIQAIRFARALGRIDSRRRTRPFNSARKIVVMVVMVIVVRARPGGRMNFWPGSRRW